MPLDDPWYYWLKSPPDPAFWTVIEFVEGDEEGPSDNVPQKASVADMLEQEAAGRLMIGVWWRPIPW